jgi:hypothetical protein
MPPRPPVRRTTTQDGYAGQKGGHYHPSKDRCSPTQQRPMTSGGSGARGRAEPLIHGSGDLRWWRERSGELRVNGTKGTVGEQQQHTENLAVATVEA